MTIASCIEIDGASAAQVRISEERINLEKEGKSRRPLYGRGEPGLDIGIEVYLGIKAQRIGEDGHVVSH